MTKPHVTITYSDLELAALVLQDDTLLEASLKVCMATQRSGSYNAPTVLWSMRKASAINPVVADILRIHALHSRKFFLNPSV